MKKPNITEKDKQERREVAQYAQDTLALEGFYISEAEKAHAQRFVDGEIDLDTFVNAPHEC